MLPRFQIVAGISGSFLPFQQVLLMFFQRFLGRIDELGWGVLFRHAGSIRPSSAMLGVYAPPLARRMACALPASHGVCWRFKDRQLQAETLIRSVVLEDDMLLNQSTNRLIPDGHKQELGSMYCADPDCEYCKQLRKAEEQVMNNARRGT